MASTMQHARILQDQNRELERKLKIATDALKPFAEWASDNVAAEEDGGYIWDGIGCQKERISVWFGPSDFGRLAEAYAALSVSSSRGK